MNNEPDTSMNPLSRAVNKVVQNPIPAAIAVAGIAWLVIIRMIRKAHTAKPSLTDNPLVNSAKTVAEQAGTQVDNLSRKARELGAEAQDRAEQAGSQVEQLSKMARDVGAEAQQRVEQLGSQVQETVHETSHDLADTAQKIADRVKSGKS